MTATEQTYCALCWRNAHAGQEMHHQVPKRMGGRKGAAKVRSEAAENKVVLCRVCHNATHGLRSSDGDFSCRTCPKLLDCFFGRKLEKLSIVGMEPPWQYQEGA